MLYHLVSNEEVNEGWLGRTVTGQFNQEAADGQKLTLVTNDKTRVYLPKPR
ncbi:hypothetical protein [Psychrobium sp. 1_MG-2023]|uniref:hypothetical protein n=1 Tax=Psychrobium sp. 1_MG-2023 TaxID=3062624 RepID=UPI002733D101|nr:hypothetical protein [Psychrobium sp. 1_MG-2023]MDP2562772.1 hypothetical protein [Psychrobium sp. 1_MG-2023]